MAKPRLKNINGRFVETTTETHADTDHQPCQQEISWQGVWVDS